MGDLMTFPDTVEEFMEQYKMIDTEQIYSNGTEYVPIFRMKQWFEHLPAAESEIIRCKNCKYYKFADNRAFGFPVKRCEWTGFEDVDEDDFCSRAERRNDECY